MLQGQVYNQRGWPRRIRGRLGNKIKEPRDTQELGRGRERGGGEKGGVRGEGEGEGERERIDLFTIKICSNVFSN